MSDNIWRTLYYPYADFRDEKYILFMSLYCDELYFLQPGLFAPPKQINVQSESASMAWPRVSDQLMPLVEKKIIRKVEPEILGISHLWMPGYESQVRDTENRRILVSNIQADVDDKALQSFSNKHGKLVWSFPNMQFIGIAAAGLLFDVSEQSGKHIGLEYITDNSATVRYTDAYRDVIDVELVEKRISHSSWDRESIQVPFHVGESLMINVALLAATRLSATPITDNPIHRQFLENKLKRVVTDSTVQTWLSDHGYRRRNQSTQLASEVMKIAIPDIEGLTAKKVIELRRKCAGQLMRFRVEMLKLATDLESQPWEDQFSEEVYDIVQSQIQPALIELKSEVGKLKRELGIKLVEKTISTAPLSLITSLYAGLPIEIALAASAGIGTILQLMDYWHQKKSIKSNGLSYLLEFSR